VIANMTPATEAISEAMPATEAISLAPRAATGAGPRAAGRAATAERLIEWGWRGGCPM